MRNASPPHRSLRPRERRSIICFHAWHGSIGALYCSRIRHDVTAVIEMRDVRQRLLEIGGEPSGMTPEEFSARVRKEIAMWKKVAAEVRLEPK